MSSFKAYATFWFMCTCVAIPITWGSHGACGWVFFVPLWTTFGIDGYLDEWFSASRKGHEK